MERLFRGDDVLFKLEDYPFFYFPYVQGDANDPLGPLTAVSFNYSNKVFGFELMTTFNMYDLIGIDPLPDTK